MQKEKHKSIFKIIIYNQFTMKKLVLFLALTFMISCSNDDSNDNKQVTQECYMKVLSLSSGNIGGVAKYRVYYGTSDQDMIELIVTKEVSDFYQNRLNAGNNHWIGEVDHE